MDIIDLHIHSTASDGSFTPAEIVEYATKKELYAISLTDHDTLSGIPEAIETIKKIESPIKFIPGIEISSRYVTPFLNFEIHILGYFIDYKNQKLNTRLDEIKNERKNRNIEMLHLLKKQGVHFEIEELEEKFKGATITRMNIAQHMFDEGIVKDKREAFKKYIGSKAPSYVPRALLDPEEAFCLITSFGGIPVLAHPVQYRLTPAYYDEMLVFLKENGLKGIEAIHSTNTDADERYFRRLANDHDLFITGGSDFHGKMKPDIDIGTGFGNLYIPKYLLNSFNRDF